MTENVVLRELLTPMCPLGTADRLILSWVLPGEVFRVKQVDGFYLDVGSTFFNYRLCTTWIDNEITYDRWWCYVGKSRVSWIATVLAAAMWDGSDDTEPMSWNRNGQTGEWREPGASQTWQTSSAVEVAAERMDQERGWPAQ